MQPCRIDHITITAPTLADGVRYAESALGVPLQAGGEHPRMGTHNMLLRLGEAMFLEVIAINPAAPAPPRPRWFALDGLLAGTAPRLSTWVARVASMPAADELPAVVGAIEPMSRGALNWLITIPADGSLPLGGAAPALIEWQTEAHPALRMQDRGCSLLEFSVAHPDAQGVSALLRVLGLDDQVNVQALPPGSTPRLKARIGTPSGVRELGG